MINNLKKSDTSKIHIIAVANRVLEIDEYKLNCLRLQRILYFIYGANLVKNPNYTMSEGPYATLLGPIFPKTYRTFKKYKDAPIRKAAKVRLPKSKNNVYISIIKGGTLDKVIKSTYEHFCNFDDKTLTKLTHQPGTPWDAYYLRCGRRKNRIPDIVIREHFQKGEAHMIINPHNLYPPSEDNIKNIRKIIEESIDNDDDVDKELLNELLDW